MYYDFCAFIADVYWHSNKLPYLPQRKLRLSKLPLAIFSGAKLRTILNRSFFFLTAHHFFRRKFLLFHTIVTFEDVSLFRLQNSIVSWLYKLVVFFESNDLADWIQRNSCGREIRYKDISWPIYPILSFGHAILEAQFPQTTFHINFTGELELHLFY